MEKRANMPAEERAAKNAAVCKSVLASATYRFADTLLLYYPRADEVDVLPIARAALEAGKKVAFPKCHPADKSMDFHFVSSVDDFEKGGFACAVDAYKTYSVLFVNLEINSRKKQVNPERHFNIRAA